MIVSAALVPATPLMLAEYRSLTDPGGPWRAASVAALTEALDQGAADGPPTEIVVLTAIPTGALTVTNAFRMAPPGLRIARMLIGQVRAAGVAGRVTRGGDLPVEEVALAEDATGEQARALGFVAGNLRAGQGADAREARTILLVVADGAASRDPKTPSDLDGQADAYDRAWMTAVEQGSPRDLAGLDEELAARVLAAGRAPMQALGAAADGLAVCPRVLAAGQPFGVWYAAAVWACG